MCQDGQTLATARTRLYRSGTVIAEGFPVAEISDRIGDPDVIVWLDLEKPNSDDLKTIRDEFELDPRSIKDALAIRERPKLVRYDDHLFVNLYAVSLSATSGRLMTSEIAAFVTRQALITGRKDTRFDADRLVEAWDDNPGLSRNGVGFLLYGLMNLVVDGHFDAVHSLDDELERLEDHLFGLTEDGRFDVSQRSFELRKSLVRLRRVVLPMREVVNALMRRNVDVVSGEMASSYQDLYDHVLRATEWTEGLRDFLSTIHETHLTIQSNRLNETMKKLTGWAAIIAVPTAVTGFFGQNVPYPGFGHESGFYASFVIMIAIAVALYVAFRRRGWL